ncbi:MAG: hypothetical protein QF410_12055 [Planctomycetota bacterium]|nr:hypothetical protein [Planctomycetota bacterium]MDP6762988.1 hypothetical protein [Planctomycetota bacterium]
MAVRTSAAHLVATASAAILAFLAGALHGARRPAPTRAVAPAPHADDAPSVRGLRAPRRPPAPPVPVARAPLAGLASAALAATVEGSARTSATQREVAALSVRLLIALGRTDDAARRLLTSPARESAVHTEVAEALEREGRTRLAVEVATARFAIDPWAEDCFEVLLRLAPADALDAADDWRSRLPAWIAEDGSLDSLRGRALCALGRARDAAALARDPQELVDWNSPRSCSPLSGKDWEWEAAAAASPRETEAILRRLVGDGRRPGATTVRRLGELLGREGRTHELEELFELCRGRAADDEGLALVLADLCPERGWALIERECAYAPGEEELALPLARRLRSSGQPEEAAAVLGGLLSEHWSDSESLTEWGREDPETFLAMVAGRSRALAAATPETFEGVEDLDEALGDLADVEWRLGRRAAAVASWRRAQALDPQDGEWFEALRRVEVGLDPLHW